MTTAEVVPPGTTYEWLSNLPLASSAGNQVYSWYESSKNCCRLSQYALGTVESSVKYATSTAAPLVKKLDRPIQAVDSFAVKQLVKLEEKVPAIKSQPDEVVTYLTDSKEAITDRITKTKDSLNGRITDGRDAISTKVTSGKDAIYTHIQAGSDAIANSRAGILVSDGKQALTTGLIKGKDTISSTLASGRDVVYVKVQNGAEAIANTRAGTLVGSGVDRTLSATETVIDYLLPPEENEKELLSEYEKVKEDVEMTTISTEQLVTPEPSETETIEEEEEEEKEKEGVVAVECSPGRVYRVRTLSRKVKLRMYYRSMRRLHGVQQQCKSTLEQLRTTVDVLKAAQSAREGVEKQYKNLTAAIKDLEEHMKKTLTRHAKGEEKISWLPEENEEEDDEIQWLTPKPKSRLQASLDYAKQLSERVYTASQSVAGAATYLPHQLKDGATHVYEYAQELYTTLKPAKVPTDLPANALNRISELLDTQLGYIRQLGSYITSVLQKRPSDTPAGDTHSEASKSEDGDNSQDEEELNEDDLSSDPSTSQPPGSESGTDDDDEPGSGEEGDN